MLPGKTYTPDELIRILWRRRWMLLLPAAVVGCAASLYSHTLPDRFRSETSILVVPQRVPEAYVRSTVTGRIEDRLQSISQQILSRTRLERIILDFNLYDELRRRAPMEDAIETMRRDVSVRVVKGDAFTVSYVGDSPQLAMKVTQRLASLFIEENLRDREILAEGTNQFLESQLEDARRRLIEQERKVEAYKLRNAGQLPSQLPANMQALQNLQLQIQAVVDSIARDRDRRLAIERELADAAVMDSQAMIGAPAGVVQPVDPGAVLGGTIAQQLEAAQSLLRQLELRLRPEHPDVIRMQRVVRELLEKAEAQASKPTQPAPDPDSQRATAQILIRQNRSAQLQTELRNLDRAIAAKEEEQKRLRDRAADYQSRAEAAPVRESELIELTRDYSTIQSLYASLLSKREDSKMAANLERRQIGEQFKLLDPARTPERPFTPDRMRLATMGLALGLALGVGLVGVLEFFDKTLRRDRDVVNVLHTPTLVTIPMMLSRRERRLRIAWTLLTNAGGTALVLACGSVVGWTMLRAARVL